MFSDDLNQSSIKIESCMSNTSPHLLSQTSQREDKVISPQKPLNQSSCLSSSSSSSRSCLLLPWFKLKHLRLSLGPAGLGLGQQRGKKAVSSWNSLYWFSHSLGMMPGPFWYCLPVPGKWRQGLAPHHPGIANANGTEKLKLLCKPKATPPNSHVGSLP